MTAGTALLGGACGLVFGFTLEALIAALFCWMLVVITRTDLEHRLIPDKIVLPGAVVLLALRTIDDPSVEWVLCALGAGLVLFLIVLVYPRGLGMGDVKLSAFLGAGLGAVRHRRDVPRLLPRLRAGAPRASSGTGERPASTRSRSGRFSLSAAVVALFWGDAILDWYRDLGTS